MNDASAPTGAGDLARAEELIAELERQMPQLQQRNPGPYAIANAWAVRHDAILALTPPPMRADMERRLSRIGIRWGVAPGPRVTQEFRAMGGAAGLRSAPPIDESE
ncbi:hypothetical protein ACFQZQ_06225 [Lysobacter koreensis]|uniref:Uncharacterized protein n=1 Tax=Lysobacter koreensis TaxID=266122 RepID=A0ABW2YN16_9GAMM